MAAAFEAAGGFGVVTTSNAAITASLQAAGMSGERQQFSIDPPQALGAPPTTGYANDPVNTATGNFLEPECDLAFIGGNATLRFDRMYNSLNPDVGAFGRGWSSIAGSWSAGDPVLGGELVQVNSTSRSSVIFAAALATPPRTRRPAPWLRREHGRRPRRRRSRPAPSSNHHPRRFELGAQMNLPLPVAGHVRADETHR